MKNEEKFRESLNRFLGEYIGLHEQVVALVERMKAETPVENEDTEEAAKIGIEEIEKREDLPPELKMVLKTVLAGVVARKMQERKKVDYRS